MKSIQIMLICICAFCSASGVYSSDTLFVDSGMYHIDTVNKLIIVNQDLDKLQGSISSPIQTVLMDQTYELPNEIKSIEKAIQYRVLDTLGISYSLFFSDLPIIELTCKDSIVDEPKRLCYFSMSESNGTITKSNIGIEIRGSGSRSYPKKSYRIEFWNDTIGNDKQDYSLLDMRSDNDWNLQAMYNEPLKIRTLTSYCLWKQIDTLYYAKSEPKAINSPNLSYVELFLNNKYQGVYALMEPIDRKQLKLDKTYGRLYKSVLWGAGNGFAGLPPYSNDTTYWSGFEQEYPEQPDWQDLFSFVELFVAKPDSVFLKEYPSQISIKNTANYFLFLNLVSALDNKQKNCFYAKYTKDTPYFILPWDLDGTFGTDWGGLFIVHPTFFLTNNLFDRLFIDNSAGGFKDVLVKRWFELRKKVITHENIMSIFRKNFNILRSNAIYDREEIAWSSYKCDTNNLDFISTWLDKRIAFLDSTFTVNAPISQINDDTNNLDLLEIYPNPVSNYLYIKFNRSTKEFNLKIINTLGKQVYSENASDDIRIDLSALQPGVYYVLLNFGDSIITKKIIKN